MLSKNKKSYLYDGGGLRLLIYPNGTKIWLFNYIKPYLNKRTEISLGAFPELSLTRGYSISRYYITAWVGCS
ncbi:integrase arm-type DNA-binding domain-containing protein [Actinobacillus seminis]|uniref:integrase arm-type DNA-binding domain-containing protein n=1 Tax=Actinobacillus seminis TaxID=722 RepID=UPI0030154CCB